MADLMQDIKSLCKRRGFIFQGSDIYGGLANTWDYGPMGAQLKKNVKNHWWQKAVESRGDIEGLDGAILMSPRVWEASGHAEGFTDPLVEDVETHQRYRADHLIEEELDVAAEGMSMEEMQQAIEENDIKSPDGNDLTEPKRFNLMFETSIGPTSEGQNTFLRPETAQAIFINFKKVLNTTRQQLPFGIAQIGKAFRNEITPGNYIFRTLEFEQMEIEYFIEQEDWEDTFEDWDSWLEQWAEEIGLDMSRMHRFDKPESELSHYAKKTVDFEFEFPFGTKELWGLAYRTDFDLKNHQEHSGENLAYPDPQDQSKKIIPHVIEPSLGVDRTLLALLVSAYNKDEEEDRVVMEFEPEIAPNQVAVFPLMDKDGLGEKAQTIYEDIRTEFRVEYDGSGSIGKRYRRQDEIGTPYCITVDYDSLEGEGVTVRDRDSMEQDRVQEDQLIEYINNKIK
ncbi:MAG: glycine--tRNA ligase [Candidatus Paceibacteria bacterium]